MENKVLLSIVIPVYNAERFLNDCLDSCLCQDFEEDELEIICIDDGSTDGSLKILREYEDKHSSVKVITKKNGGVSSARNVGIRAATGEYICFTDNDNFYEAHYLKRIVNIMREKNLCALSYKIKSHLSENAHFTEYKPTDEKLLVLTADTSPEIPKFALTVLDWIYQRKLIIDNHILFNEDLSYGEDTFFSYEIYMILYEKDNVGMVDEYIYNYRDVSTSATNGGFCKKKHMDSMRALMKHYMEKYHEIKDRDEINEFLLKHALARCSLSVQAYLFDLSLETDDIKTVKEELKRLKEDDIYPYPIPWFNIKPIKGAFGQTVVNYISMLFPIKPYYLLWCRIVHMLKKIKKR